MKYLHVYTLFLISVFLISCGQNPEGEKKISKKISISSATKGKKIIINSQAKDIISSRGPTTSVRTIRQGRNGDMWLVSREGIIRYDGKTFTNLTNKIGSHGLWDILEDRRGNIWFTSESGASYYDGESVQNFRTGDVLASQVYKIYEDKAGIIWFGTGEGISRYDARLPAGQGKSLRNFKMNEGPAPADPNDSVRVPDHHKQLQHFEDYWMINETNDRVHTILEDKTGKFWFGTWGYASVYDGKTFTTITDNDGEPFTKVNSIIEDKKGNIWLGGRNGLWRYDGKIFTRVTGNSVEDICEDSKGNIWTISGSYSGEHWALLRYDGKSLSDKNPTVIEIKSGDIGLFGISEAPDGSIWVGSADGVYRYDGKTFEKL